MGKQSHIVTLQGKTYNVMRLWGIIEGRPSGSVRLDSLQINRSSRSGFSKRRLEAADLCYPIILYHRAGRYSIVDGRHRAAKAHDIGQHSIEAIFVSDEDLAQIVIAHGEDHE